MPKTGILGRKLHVPGARHAIRLACGRDRLASGTPTGKFVWATKMCDGAIRMFIGRSASIRRPMSVAVGPRARIIRFPLHLSSFSVPLGDEAQWSDPDFLHGLL